MKKLILSIILITAVLCIIPVYGQQRLSERLILVNIQNNTGNQDMDWVAEGFEQEISNRLSAAGESLIINSIFEEEDEDFSGVHNISGVLEMGSEGQVLINVGSMSGAQQDTYVTRYESQGGMRDVFNMQEQAAEEVVTSMNLNPRDLVNMALDNVDVRVEVSVAFAPPMYVPPEARLAVAVPDFRSMTPGDDNLDKAAALRFSVIESISEFSCITMPNNDNLPELPANIGNNSVNELDYYNDIADGNNLDIIMIGSCQFIEDLVMITIKWYDNRSDQMQTSLTFSVNGSLENPDELISEINHGISMSIGNLFSTSD